MPARRISLFSSLRTLEVCAPNFQEHMRPYCPSRCVAPSAIFSDYDSVMARLRAERLEMCKKEVPDEERTRDLFREQERNRTLKHTESDTSAGSSSPESNSSALQDHGMFDDDDDDEEYQERPHVRRAALDISNTYAGRIRRKPSFLREPRRPKPYDCRRSTAPSTDQASVPVRCAYVSQEGVRCRKINRSPQEGGRHWKSCHLYKEAKEMLTGLLPVGQGTAITSAAQLSEVAPCITCPRCNALITRSDAMRRHRRTNCKAPEDVQVIRNGQHEKKARRVLK